jgi:hypothetical protein
MKIKLQDYGLISIEWIDKEIERLKEPIPYWDGIYISAGQLERVELLEEIKEQLIPSEKLADKSWDEGWHFGIVDGNAFPSKQEYLKSEIEIE